MYTYTQLQETIQAEKEDNAAMVREKAYISAQHTQAGSLLKSADASMPKIDGM